MATLIDFGDKKRDKLQVVQNLFGVGRQAQAIGYTGPILGTLFLTILCASTSNFIHVDPQVRNTT